MAKREISLLLIIGTRTGASTTNILYQTIKGVNSIVLIDYLGRIVKEHFPFPTQTTHQFDVNKLPVGFYFVRLSLLNGQVLQKRG